MTSGDTSIDTPIDTSVDIALDRVPQLSEIADQVYAYVQPDGGWCLNNAALIGRDHDAVLVDTAATERRALALRDAVAGVAAAAPRVLVNTHSHGDHTFGNNVFAGRATVIAHDRARSEMLMAGLHLAGLWPDVDWGDVAVAAPTITFTDRLSLHVADFEVELIALDPAHTGGDVVAWLPRQRVLIAGDLVMAGVTPFCMMGSVSGSLRAIERLRDLAPLVVVPGHGPVGDARLLDDAEGYLRRIQQIAHDGIAQGLTPLDAARAAELGRYAEWLDPERLVPNLHRAYQESDGGAPGAPLDVGVLFGELVTFHGGMPACHA